MNHFDTARLRLALGGLDNALSDLDGGDLEAARESLAEARDELADELDL